MITTDFRADLVAHIDARLGQLGYRPDAAGDARQRPAPYLMLLLRALRRMPDLRPRRIVRAPDFTVPVAHDAGFQALIHAAGTGQSLRPWLSTRVDGLTKRDALLDDWGIHHFHLGVVAHPKLKGFVERTNEVAFALVRRDAVYFLVATSHNHDTAPLVWTEIELVDIVHRNWPMLIEAPKLDPHDRELTATGHARARAYRANTGVTVSDWTVYYPPGGGVMNNGDGATDFMYQMQLLQQLDDLETAVLQREAQIRAMLGVSGEVELALKARFEIRFSGGFTVDVYQPASNTSIAI